jgi:hypothetical protein
MSAYTFDKLTKYVAQNPRIWTKGQTTKSRVDLVLKSLESEFNEPICCGQQCKTRKGLQAKPKSTGVATLGGTTFRLNLESSRSTKT